MRCTPVRDTFPSVWSGRGRYIRLLIHITYLHADALMYTHSTTHTQSIDMYIYQSVNCRVIQEATHQLRWIILICASSSKPYSSSWQGQWPQWKQKFVHSTEYRHTEETWQCWRPFFLMGVVGSIEHFARSNLILFDRIDRSIIDRYNIIDDKKTTTVVIGFQ